MRNWFTQWQRLRSPGTYSPGAGDPGESRPEAGEDPRPAPRWSGGEQSPFLCCSGHWRRPPWGGRPA